MSKSSGSRGRGRRRLAASIGVLALVLSACGSDDPGQADPTDPAAEPTGPDATETEPPREPSQLNVLGFGGRLGDVIAQAFEPFEEQFNVTITWTSGATTENVARAAATASNPEYDILVLDDLNTYDASVRGLLAPIDPSIVTHYADVYDIAKYPNEDGVVFGAFSTGLFYNSETFEANGWDPPTSWDDLFRPELCDGMGLQDMRGSYVLRGIMMLGGLYEDGVTTSEAVSRGLDRMREIANCPTTFEPNAGALEDQIQLGTYTFGIHGSGRVLPLVAEGHPVRYVVPEEGSMCVCSSVSAINGAPHPEMAQQFINWFLSPYVQEIMMTEVFYGPMNSTVEIPEELAAFGVPTADVVAGMVPVDFDTVVAEREQWASVFDREIVGASG